MPIYEHFCEHCDRVEQAFRKVIHRDDPYPCLICSTPMIRCISVPMVSNDLEGYESPTTGKWIEGRRAHIEDLKRSGCRLLEPGESREIAKNAKKIRRENTEKAVDEIVNAAAKDLGFNVG